MKVYVKGLGNTVAAGKVAADALAASWIEATKSRT